MATAHLEKILNASRLGSDDGGNRYGIGPFYANGVTLWKQQIRALNLVYALASVAPPRLGEGKTVAVIGGGVSGMTAAIAAASRGSVVHLFEQRPVLCHLQLGCDTRWLHPHIYDWPAPGSENPYAGLPLLNWKAGTAADVTDQITTEFYKHLKVLRDRLHLHMGATTRLTGTSQVQWDNSSGEPRGGESGFNAIIVAVGFGVEVGVSDGFATSYWRNDSINQPKPGVTSEKPALVFISGPGDGGLIDLLRSRINGFNQGRILDELVRLPRDKSLVECLGVIGDTWRNRKKDDREFRKGWLFECYRQLLSDKAGDMQRVLNEVKKRLRPDTAAILCGGRALTFAHALSLQGASLFNTLIAFLLYELKAFNYVYGTSEPGRSGEVNKRVRARGIEMGLPIPPEFVPIQLAADFSRPD